MNLQVNQGKVISETDAKIAPCVQGWLEVDLEPDISSSADLGPDVPKFAFQGPFSNRPWMDTPLMRRHGTKDGCISSLNRNHDASISIQPLAFGKATSSNVRNSDFAHTLGS